MNSTPPPADSAAERYLNYLDELFQVDSEFYGSPEVTDGVPGVSVIVYRDVPEPGMITAATYGLSLVGHPDWKDARPELLISVESTDHRWGVAAGFVANELRGDCPFGYGMTIDMKSKVTEDSDMDAFLCFVPSLLEREDYERIDVGLEYPLTLVGLYPIHASEAELIQREGLKLFWTNPDYDVYDVKRAPFTELGPEEQEG